MVLALDEDGTESPVRITDRRPVVGVADVRLIDGGQLPHGFALERKSFVATTAFPEEVGEVVKDLTMAVSVGEDPGILHRQAGVIGELLAVERFGFVVGVLGTEEVGEAVTHRGQVGEIGGDGGRPGDQLLLDRDRGLQRLASFGTAPGRGGSRGRASRTRRRRALDRRRSRDVRPSRDRSARGPRGVSAPPRRTGRYRSAPD